MRVLFDIGHPAHVHLFRNVIRCLEKQGHRVLVAATEKEMAAELLQQYAIPFVSLAKPGQTLVAKGIRLVISTLRLASIAVRFSPDIFIAVSPVRSAPLAWVLGRPCVGLDDTEHAKLARHLYMPFVSAILTPAWYEIELGNRHLRYRGFHELAYLHPNHFTPDEEVLRELSILPGESFSVVRFVSPTPSHDLGHSGFSHSAKIRLVRRLAELGRVIVSSEIALPQELEHYCMRSRASAMHHLLAFASVYAGDAGTMTTEAALLGTPAVFCGSVGPFVGNFRYLESHYGLVRCFVDDEAAIQCAVNLALDPSAKGEWNRRRNLLLEECIDVTQALTHFLGAVVCVSSAKRHPFRVRDRHGLLR